MSRCPPSLNGTVNPVSAPIWKGLNSIQLFYAPAIYQNLLIQVINYIQTPFSQSLALNALQIEKGVVRLMLDFSAVLFFYYN